MRFSAGYQANEFFKASLMRLKGSIAEIYFPWLNFSSGRGAITDISPQRKMELDLAEFSAAGFKMNLLLNGNCYGARSQARGFFKSIGDTVEYLKGEFGLSSVTTASPLIAKFLKSNFPEIEVRASVNMEIGSTEAVEYVQNLFDAFYLKRECNFDFEKLSDMRARCLSIGKKMYILANSGCLNFCSARTFHDNLVAHQHEAAEMDNAYDFKGVCQDYLSQESAKASILCRSNFIRPEDVCLYEDLCDGMKLATRVNPNPSAIAEAYCAGNFSGNLLDITEPSHSGIFYPTVIANNLIPADFGERRLRCDMRCKDCGYCGAVLKTASINLEKRKE